MQVGPPNHTCRGKCWCLAAWCGSRLHQLGADGELESMLGLVDVCSGSNLPVGRLLVSFTVLGWLEGTPMDGFGNLVGMRQAGRYPFIDVAQAMFNVEVLTKNDGAVHDLDYRFASQLACPGALPARDLVAMSNDREVRTYHPPPQGVRC